MRLSSIASLVLLAILAITLLSPVQGAPSYSVLHRAELHQNVVPLGYHEQIQFDDSTLTNGTDTSVTPAHVDPLYFESSWAILSCFGGFIVVLTFSVMSILGAFSELGMVAATVSCAGCIANGLCFYAYYQTRTLQDVQGAAAIADIFWGIEEIGLSWYSFIILRRVLQKKERLGYTTAFYLMTALGAAFRLAILVHRQIYLDHDATDSRQRTINNMHSGYFTTIAAIELMNGFFLLKSFRPSKSSVTNSTDLFRSIARSSEFRLAFLFACGFGRAVCYSMQNTAQAAGNTAGQWDRFWYTVEVFYPIIFLVDIMAAKLSSTRGHGSQINNTTMLHHSSENTTIKRSTNARPSALTGVKVERVEGEVSPRPMSPSDGAKRHSLSVPGAHTPKASTSESSQRRPSGGVQLASINPTIATSSPSPAASSVQSPVSPRRAVNIHFHLAEATKPEMIAEIANLIKQNEQMGPS